MQRRILKGPISTATRIFNNEIIILGNDAELGSDIDPEEAQHALEIAEANLSKAEGTKELKKEKRVEKLIRQRSEPPRVPKHNIIFLIYRKYITRHEVKNLDINSAIDKIYRDKILNVNKLRQNSYKGIEKLITKKDYKNSYEL
ncbi:hypothetical protein ACJX0J_033683 [Zea mays]